MFAVVYCPEFYIQCERLFRPDLNNAALIIASNDGDGGLTIIASSVEAKKMGLLSGLQGTELTDTLNSLINHLEIKICSPNYELYGDISERFIKSLELLAPKVSPCADDKALLDLRGLEPQRLDSKSLTSEGSFQSYGRKIQQELKQWTGISAVIGTAPTKTLAKLACSAAQIFDHYEGVTDLSTLQERQSIFKCISVADINGISKKAAAKLSAINIHTALELSTAPKALIRRHSSVVVERIAIELSGLCCKELKLNDDTSDVISNSNNRVEARSFADIKQVLVAQTAGASEHLKSLSGTCDSVGVALTTVLLSKRTPRIQNALTANLGSATNSPGSIQQLATQLLESLWREDAQYHSIKLSLTGLNPADAGQFSLFSDTSISSIEPNEYSPPKAIRLETFLCPANHNHWQEKRSLLSASFTTKWSDIPRAS